jgi:hypothetical protein
MTSIEAMEQRNILWLASQALTIPPQYAAALRRAVSAGYITLSRQWLGLQSYEAYILTCAGASRLRELDGER